LCCGFFAQTENWPSHRKFAFSAEYTIDPGACGFSVVATEQLRHFHSPNYPIEYPPLLECHWLIISQEQFKQVQLILYDFRFESGTDFLEVRQQLSHCKSRT